MKNKDFIILFAVLAVVALGTATLFMHGTSKHKKKTWVAFDPEKNKNPTFRYEELGISKEQTKKKTKISKKRRKNDKKKRKWSEKKPKVQKKSKKEESRNESPMRKRAFHYGTQQEFSMF